MASQSATQDRSAASELETIRVSGRIGAEIRNIQLSGDLDDATIAAIRKALLAHKVIFFRGHETLDDAGMEAFTERLGNPIPHPNAGAAEGSRYLLDLDADSGYAASIWHTDMTFMPAYPEITVLRPVELPSAGGDTLWANCVTAYADLPAELKTLADSLRAIHSNDHDFADLFEEAKLSRLGRFFNTARQNVFVSEHPVVRVHEETGERALVLGNTFVARFAGYDARQSLKILELFQEFITRPENTVRWRWQLGDVAIWDNRATQHRSVADFGDEQRQLRRSTVHGITPTGVDGRPSRAIKPEPVAA
ncbi:MAG: TauD/TfdA family dioxygenase [Novosphingobium sp.]|nr:TauD/TfdA family dioxygenase [Novosphingobium sp.]